MKTVRAVAILFVLCLSLQLWLAPPISAAPYAYVSNRGSNTVSVINSANNAVIATVPVGNGPGGIAVRPDATRVYVGNYDDDTVSVIDATTDSVIATVAVGNAPWGMAITPNGQRLYVGNEIGGSVSVIDTATNAVVDTVPGVSSPSGLAVRPDGTRVYVASVPGTVSIIDTTTNNVISTVTVGTGDTSGLAVNSDGTRVYVGLFTTGQVAVLNTATNTVAATVQVGTQPRGVVVTPDRSRVYVANYSSNTVSVISTATNTVTATIPVGRAPWGIAVTADGSRVYVTNTSSNTVSVISTATNTVTATVPVGLSPTSYGAFISVGPTVNLTPAQVGIYRNGTWYLDKNGNGVWDGSPTDGFIGNWGGDPADKVVLGDWDNSGTTKIGVFRNGTWYLDRNGNGVWDGSPTDSLFVWGGAADIPVVGDWTGTGATKIGIYGTATGTWYLDRNGNGTWDGTPTDGLIQNWGGVPGDVPVVGEWTGGGTTKIGIYRNGTWYLDRNGNGTWDGTPTDGLIQNWGGVPGDVPVVGEWTGGGTTKIGIYRNGAWYLDRNGDGVWNGSPTDGLITNWGGVPGDVPVVGEWDGVGITKIGVYRNGTWYLDTDGDGNWDGCFSDACVDWGGLPGDVPAVGEW